LQSAVKACLRASVCSNFFYKDRITVQVFVVYEATLDRSLFVIPLAVLIACIASFSALSLPGSGSMFEI
jgi:hypothetical protein